MAYYDDRQYYPSRDRYAPQRPSYGQDPYSYADPRSRPYNGGYQQTQIVRHGENDDSYGYSRDPRRARVATVQGGAHRSRSVDGRGSYYEDSNYYYRHRPRHEQRSNHHSDRRRHKHSPRSPSNSPSPPRRRRKSFSEQALGALGLGAAASSASKHSRGRSQSRHHRSYSYSPSQTRGKSRRRRDKTEQQMSQAVKAALTAGAVEAFRLRKEPGEWTGDKGKRILTAAITAAGADGLVDRNPDKHAKTHIVESTLAGLAANHLMNGPRSKSRGKSRGRDDHKNSGLKTAATTAALAAVGKEAYDRFRSRSRPRGRSSSRDNSNDDGSPSPRRSKKRSKSVSDYINQGMGALGLGDKGKDGRHGPSSRRDERYYSESDGDSDVESQRQENPRRGRHSRDVGGPRFSSDTYLPSTSGISRAKSSEGYGSRRYHSSSDADSSDCGNSSDEEKQRKKLSRQTLIASGLATVATIHAAHTIHHGIEKRKKRMKMVEEGEMSPEEARRRRLKSNLADAASIGIAALGIGNAVQDWKEVDEKRKERSKFKKEAAEKREKRHRSQSATPTPRLPLALYPDEIEENTSAYGRPRVRAPSARRDLEWNPQSHYA